MGLASLKVLMQIPKRKCCFVQIDASSTSRRRDGDIYCLILCEFFLVGKTDSLKCMSESVWGMLFGARAGTLYSKWCIISF